MFWIIAVTVFIIAVPTILLGLCTLVEWVGLIPTVIGVFGLIVVYLIATNSIGAMGGLSMVVVGLAIRAMLTVVRDVQVQGTESTSGESQ